MVRLPGPWGPAGINVGDGSRWMCMARTLLSRGCHAAQRVGQHIRGRYGTGSGQLRARAGPRTQVSLHCRLPGCQGGTRDGDWRSIHRTCPAAGGAVGPMGRSADRRCVGALARCSELGHGGGDGLWWWLPGLSRSPQLRLRWLPRSTACRLQHPRTWPTIPTRRMNIRPPLRTSTDEPSAHVR